MGTLSRLQKSAAQYLRSLSELRRADIFAENIDPEEGGKAEGMRVVVMSPVPVRASKYAAGPAFSEVEISVEISRDDSNATRAPSVLDAAEAVSRALHFWTPPLESGYGKLSMSDTHAWLRTGKSSIRTTFKTQSVLQ